MGAFEQSKTVEARGLAELLPFIKEIAHAGRFVLINKGPLAKRLQEVIGDLLWHKDADRFYTVEIKIEAKETGRIFLETWSNKNLDNRQSHFDRGSNPGWMMKCCSELLFYYFLDTGRLYVFDLFKLKRWAFGNSDGPGRLYGYDEKGQKKYEQMNDTHGRVVPLDVLYREVGYRLAHPRQLVLDLGDAAE